MTTTQESTALATREQDSEWSLAALGRRIELNKQSGWGLEKGSAYQLNAVALYCQKHRLLPGDDVTLYEGHPWITVDGRVKLMRRHKDEYRGHACRPLTKDEKEAWGYDPDDLVIETTVRTVTYGEMKAHGKVSKAEKAGSPVAGVRHNPVAKFHPVEIATKRSLARAERYTFGTDSMVDDEDVEDARQTVIIERDDPVRNKALAARYDEIYGADEAHAFAEQPAAPAVLVDHETADNKLPCSIKGCTKVVASVQLQRDSMEKFAAVMCRPHFEAAVDDSQPEPESF